MSLFPGFGCKGFSKKNIHVPTKPPNGLKGEYLQKKKYMSISTGYDQNTRIQMYSPSCHSLAPFQGDREATGGDCRILFGRKEEENN